MSVKKTSIQRGRFMITKLFSWAFLGYSLVAFTDELPAARVIDLGKMGVTCIPGFASLDLSILAEEYHPFNGAIELCPYFNYLKSAFHLDTVVETGTGIGETTSFFAFLFDTVHSMEVDVGAFQKACHNLRSEPNATVYYGDSPDILRQILPSIKEERVLYYLDSYSATSSRWPLLEELELISSTHKDNCIVVINEIKVPGRNDIPYRTFNGHECSFDYFKKALDKIFSSYIIYYVIPKSVNAGAKFVAVPQKRQFSGGWKQ
jgi:hypothetical protein